jgi:hypothetical protein
MRTWGPDGQELLGRGGWIEAFRSAPWTVWVGTGLLLADQILDLAHRPRPGAVVMVPVTLLTVGMVLGGIRLAWQWALVLAAGYVVFALAPPNTIVGAVVALTSLPFLLAPGSRRYFRPGRIWLPPRLAEMDHEDWEKGGIRQLALKERVPAYLAPRAVPVFFVACRGRRRASAFGQVVRRHHVFAVAGADLVVLRLGRPSLVSARIVATVADLPLDDPQIDWDDDAFRIEGRDYRPIRGRAGPGTG